jgi:hypothetical protein
MKIRGGNGNEEKLQGFILRALSPLAGAIRDCAGWTDYLLFIF